MSFSEARSLMRISYKNHTTLVSYQLPSGLSGWSHRTRGEVGGLGTRNVVAGFFGGVLTCPSFQVSADLPLRPFSGR